MSQEVIEHQCTVLVRKVKKVSDKRYKTGYRPTEVIAESYAYIYPLYPDQHNPQRKTSGTNIDLNNIDKRKDGLYQTLANVEVNLAMTEMEKRL